MSLALLLNVKQKNKYDCLYPIYMLIKGSKVVVCFRFKINIRRFIYCDLFHFLHNFYCLESRKNVTIYV